MNEERLIDDAGGGATSLPPLIVIAGATATGKTGLSIRLAETLAGEGIAVEIISADSRQVYRGLDIGTAKATAEERGRVPHFGLDLVEPDAPFTVADFTAHARDALAGIAERGGIAVLAGGTGLYLRAVARGIDTSALPWDPAVRAGLEADLGRFGCGALAERLTSLAPGLAATVDLRNPRRVVRALEIALIAGDRPRPPLAGYPGPCLWVGLEVEPEAHRQRIVERARGQFDAGLVEEARTLLRRYPRDLPSFSAIGYAEAFGVIDGTLTRDEAIAIDARRNLQFARRQRTWFRSERGIAWVDATGDPLPEALALVGSFVEGALGPRFVVASPGPA